MNGVPTATEELKGTEPLVTEVSLPVAVTLNCCADAEPARANEAQAIRSQQATLADDRRETTGEQVCRTLLLGINHAK